MDIIVAQAATPGEAQADYTAELGEAQTLIATKLPPGVSVKLDTANTAGVGDQASTVTGGETLLGKQISFTGIYVISGSTFFTIGDLVVGAAPPTATAIQDQAKVVVGRV